MKNVDIDLKTWLRMKDIRNLRIKIAAILDLGLDLVSMEPFEAYVSNCVYLNLEC